MQPEFWHERWAEERIGFHLPTVNPWLIEYIKEFTLFKGAKVFVPLCGKSLDLAYLLEREFKVTGVELSTKAVEDFFSENKIVPRVETRGEFKKYSYENLTIFNGDFFNLSNDLLGRVDFVFDRASLIAMPKDMRKYYVRHMLGLLADCRQMLLVTMEYPQKKMPGPPFSVSENEVQTLYAAHFGLELLASKDLTAEGKFSDMDYAVEKAWSLRID